MPVTIRDIAKKLNLSLGVVSRAMDGFILTHLRVEDWRADYLLLQGVPFTALESVPDSRDFPCIDIDRQGGIVHLIEHLVEGSFRRIACIGGPSGLQSQAGQLEGYRQGLNQAGFPFAPTLLAVPALIGIPAIILMATGLREAGEEAMRPKKEHCLYGGMYTQLRHPQAVGEVFLFPALAFLLHSPFLTLFSLIYFPIFIILCCAEEQDLLLWYGEAYADYCKHTGAFWPIRKQNEKGCGGCVG